MDIEISEEPLRFFGIEPDGIGTQPSIVVLSPSYLPQRSWGLSC